MKKVNRQTPYLRVGSERLLPGGEGKTGEDPLDSGQIRPATPVPSRVKDLDRQRSRWDDGTPADRTENPESTKWTFHSLNSILVVTERGSPIGQAGPHPVPESGVLGTPTVSPLPGPDD